MDTQLHDTVTISIKLASGVLSDGEITGVDAAVVLCIASPVRGVDG